MLRLSGPRSRVTFSPGQGASPRPRPAQRRRHPVRRTDAEVGADSAPFLIDMVNGKGSVILPFTSCRPGWGPFALTPTRCAVEQSAHQADRRRADGPAVLRGPADEIRAPMACALMSAAGDRHHGSTRTGVYRRRSLVRDGGGSDGGEQRSGTSRARGSADWTTSSEKEDTMPLVSRSGSSHWSTSFSVGGGPATRPTRCISGPRRRLVRFWVEGFRPAVQADDGLLPALGVFG